MFDVAIEQKSRVELKGNLPIEDKSWNVGLIIGPSGSGKSSIARELFGSAVVSGFDWPSENSILDGFPQGCSIKTVTGLLNAVGFGSVPNWLRPFRVLSNGEQFRATVARALAEQNSLIVLDEFTSVVDRQVAKIASHCVQKTVRRDNRRLIAISCHYDIVEWLQPDWVYEPHLAAFEWRSLQRRPEIGVEIRSVNRNVWPIFSKYHYLTGRLASGAICIAGFLEGRCVAFTSAIRFPHPRAKDIYQEHRTVVLPDYQGLGLGGRLSDWLGMALWERGWRLYAMRAALIFTSPPYGVGLKYASYVDTFDACLKLIDALVVLACATILPGSRRCRHANCGRDLDSTERAFAYRQPCWAACRSSPRSTWGTEVVVADSHSGTRSQK
jgi:predicted ABC-type transport system involved in lysophospholipase L1 biosynthesis ATPase subunit